MKYVLGTILWIALALTSAGEAKQPSTRVNAPATSSLAAVTEIEEEFPTVARNQTRGITPNFEQDPGCDLEGCSGPGSTEWGLCKTNRVCSLTLQQCVFSQYLKCQVRVGGHGDRCQGC
jgi:hypothetical protein